MKKIVIIIAGLGAAGVLSSAPALADADDLTNVQVYGHVTPSPKFVPYKVVVPVPSTGGQGPYTHRNEPLTIGGVVVGHRSEFDDGLSDSSRDMLDGINGYD